MECIDRIGAQPGGRRWSASMRAGRVVLRTKDQFSISLMSNNSNSDDSPKRLEGLEIRNDLSSERLLSKFFSRALMLSLRTFPSPPLCLSIKSAKLTPTSFAGCKISQEESISQLQSIQSEVKGLASWTLARIHTQLSIFQKLCFQYLRELRVAYIHTY